MKREISNSPRHALFTAEHLFHIRSAKDFDLLRVANRDAQILEEEFGRAVDRFYRKLPDGYTLCRLEETTASGEPLYSVYDDALTCIGWPLTLSESHERAWSNTSATPPLFSDDPEVLEVTDLLSKARDRATAASIRIDQTHRKTVGEPVSPATLPIGIAAVDPRLAVEARA